MSRGLQYISELLLGLALGFFYYVCMVQIPKSAFLDPFLLSNRIVLYFGIPFVFSALLFVYSRFKVYALVSLAAAILSYFWLGTELIRS